MQNKVSSTFVLCAFRTQTNLSFLIIVKIAQFIPNSQYAFNVPIKNEWWLDMEISFFLWRFKENQIQNSKQQNYPVNRLLGN